ncbi:MAG: hypothetical protein ABSH44_24230 [Bryobacteraceae bacterium]|jgi:hypothetical protein
MIDAKNVKQPGSGGKSLKEQNRWQLWLVVAVNSLFLYGVVQANAIKVAGLRAVFTDANNLLPVGFALVISTVLNGVLSAENKARLVFLRWRNALPGHRAFSEHAGADPRIDLAALAKLHGSGFPSDPVDQNRAWYRIYKTVEKEPSIHQVHRDFLLLRDYTGLCALFIVLYGSAGLYAIPSRKVGLLYVALLILQYVVVRQAASNYGIRFVTTVLAQKAAAPEKAAPKKAAPKKTVPKKAASRVDPAEPPQ